MRTRCIALCMAFIVAITSFASASLCAAEPLLTARAAILLDVETGQVLYSHNAEEALAPASITKVMTLYLMFDALKAGEVSLGQTCVVSKRAFDIKESTMWLNEGDRVPFVEIVKGVAIASGNDASIVAAETLSGTLENFVDRMNSKAAELGMEHSHFRNSHGLDEDGHVMSAHDIALLGYYLVLNHPEALEYTSMRTMSYDGVPLESQNDLLEGGYLGADGIKTGFTDDAGYSLLATAKQGDQRLISVLLGSSDPNIRSRESATLLDYGFSDAFTRLEQVKMGDGLDAKLYVKKANLDWIGLEIGASVPLVIAQGSEADISTVVDVPEQLQAPVYKGDVVGTYKVLYRDEEMASVPILAAEDSGEAHFLKALWQSIVEFFMGLVRIV